MAHNIHNINQKRIEAFKANILRNEAYLLAKQDAMRAIRLEGGKVNPARFSA